jgi:RNA polymerase sigma-70 factor (ECF subfamily)
VLTEKREASAFVKAELPPDRLSGQPITLAGDDGTADGHKSIAGGGHARKFAAPGEGEWYLRSVSAHAARYGPAKAPDTQFDVVLCDAEMKPVATWKKPHAAVARGKNDWVRLDVPPTRVPKDFTVCLVFRPTASSGVFMDYDASSKGDSTTAVPGKPGPALADGNWMIRVELDRPKGADALKAP